MKAKMNLQLFEDGTGAGSAGQGGNAGTGNGGQNNAEKQETRQHLVLNRQKKSPMPEHIGQSRQR